MIIFSKVFAIFLAILVISKSLDDFKKKQETLTTFLFWTIAWLGIVYITLNPSLFYSFVTSLSNENIGIGTFVGIAFIFIFFITYRIYIKAHRLEQKVRDIVMRIGIKDIEN